MSTNKITKTVFMPAFPDQGYDLEIVKGDSIRIMCLYKNMMTPKFFDKTFKIGDFAEYSSYGCKYIGQIVSITDKTVTVYHKGEKSRLTLEAFAWRNYDFDLTEVKEYNQKESMHI